MVTVAATTITNSEAIFPTNIYFVDFDVQVPEVNPTNLWAGKNIGIELLATPDLGDPQSWGGYWDADIVRLVEEIPVPNYSFESPDIGTNSPYAAPELEAWEETPQPSWYDPANFDGAPWYYQVGTFYNLPDFTNSMQTNTAFIYNCDGVQAVYFQVVPDVGILQTLDAPYNAGKSYTLTVGLIGGGGGMVDGSTFQLSLYYLQDSTNMVTVAETTVTNSEALFPTDTEFVDFQVQVPPVKATDPWAGQDIGIELAATPDLENPELWGGYWDADNVRLVETTPLGLANPALGGGQLQLTVQSEPGEVFQILSTTNLSLPLSAWTNLATLTNITGTLSFVDPSPSTGQRFYTAEKLP